MAHHPEEWLKKSGDMALIFRNNGSFCPDYSAVPGSIINECFENVDTYIKEHGGQRVLGRSIWQRANVLIEAEAHAVWKSPAGHLVDVTPHANEVSAILFLADPKMTYEDNLIPNIRKALTSSPLVAEFIVLYNERDHIAAETPGNAYSLTADMFRRMIEIEQAFNQRVGRNDPCPCQSVSNTKNVAADAKLKSGL